MTSLHTWTTPWNGSLPWLPAQRGYVGVDIGSRAIKLAQVERTGGHWRIAAKWLLPLPAPAAAPDADWLQNALSTVRTEIADLRSSFRGRRAAVSLPLSLAPLRTLEIPRGTDQEMRAMVREELADELGDQREFNFGYWEMCPPSKHAEGAAHVAAVATQHELSNCATSALLDAGLECQILDSLSCALARCAQLAAPHAADQPALVLDLGYSTPQLAVCSRGRPWFCRSLPDCGLRMLMRPLCDRLQLSERECWQLLSRVGISLPTGDSSSAARVVYQMMAPQLDHLAHEIERTLAYIRKQFFDLLPTRMWIFGGGGGIRNLTEILATRTGLSVERWQPPQRGELCVRGDEAPFAVAAALSLLAWEKDICT